MPVNQLDGAFLEGLMGKSWSLERTQGWGAMMQRYLRVRENLRPPAVVGFNVAGDPRDLQFMRYALGSSTASPGGTRPRWRRSWCGFGRRVSKVSA